MVVNQNHANKKPSQRTALRDLRVSTAFSSIKVYSYVHLY
nr:MAG TPA: hypothetical protein [Caudoviricetes sp.]